MNRWILTGLMWAITTLAYVSPSSAGTPQMTTVSISPFSPNQASSAGVNDTTVLTAKNQGGGTISDFRIRIHAGSTGGALVREFTFGSVAGNASVSVTWNGKNTGGSFVSDTTYVAVASNGTTENTGSTLNVIVDNTNPTVTPNSPADNSYVSGTITLDASPLDGGTDANIDHVEFYVDGTLQGSDGSSGGGWNLTYNTAGLSDGSHTWTAKAFDRAGNSASSVARTMLTQNTGSCTTTISPTTGLTGSAVVYQITVTNTTSNVVITMGSVSVAIPSGVGTPTGVTVTATDPGPLSRTWVVDGAAPPGTLQVSRSGGSPNDIDPGGTVVIQFTSTTSTTGSYQWTTTAYKNNNYTQPFIFQGSQPSVTLCTGITVTTNPSNQTVCAGNSVSFSAAATSTPSPALQWQVSTNGGSSWNDIAGATSSPLTFTAAASQNGNRYRAVFTNTCTSTNGSSATLTVDTAPSVTTNPSTQSVCSGNPASFSASASGSPAPTLQWQVSTDGGSTFNDIPGATSSPLTFTASSGDDGKRYRAVFTNTCGTSNSTAATLTVPTTPSVNLQPTDQSVCTGTTATFTAGAVAPAPPVQWQVSTDGGGSFNNIPGATSATLSFTAVLSDNGNRYRAVFSNSCGTATTSDALLTVINTSPTTANAGPDQTVCAATATLAGNTPVVGTGAWTVIAGGATVTDSASPTSGVTGLSVGVNTFVWTISISCGFSADTVTITRSASPTTADAGADQVACTTTATLAGNTPGTGIGVWTVIAGSATVTDPASPTSGVTNLSLGANSFVWTITNGVCPASIDTVVITRPAPMSLSETHVNVSCHGGSDGSIDLTVSAGTSPYSYSWNDGPTTEDRSGLAAGTYNVTVTDANGCTASTGVTITEPTAIAASTSKTDVSCFGGSNGSITVTASGGTGTLTYSRDGGSTYQASNEFTGLTAGTYPVVVRDSMLCTTAAASVIVSEPPALNVTETHVDPNCHGGSNGSIDITVSGGTSPYTYSWNDGPTTEDRTGLAAGSYTVTITDANGCQAPKVVTLNDPAAVSGSSAKTDVSCHGGSNGTITVTASGGTGTLEYSKDGGSTYQPSNLFQNLPAGTYTVVVRDANLCSTSGETVVIGEPAAISIGEIHSDVKCHNGSDGSIDISVSGGTSPYAFSWNDGPTTENRSGLTAGTYTLTVTDNAGCTASLPVTVTEPPALALTETHVDETCFGQSNGSIDLTVTGGVSPYSWSWSDGPTTEDRSGLAAGTYTVTVTDANLCTSVLPVTISQPSAVSFSVIHTDESCHGATDGSITVTASGGTGTHEYSKDGGVTFQPSNVFGNLAIGSYTIVVRDANLCLAPSQQVAIGEPDAVSIAELHGDVACNGGSNGSITLTVSGGTEPYTFSWSDGPSTEDRTNLPTGTYTVTVTDNHGCTAQKSVTISEPAALSVTETQVDVTCHGGSNGSIDVSVSGGTGPYTYSWNDGPSTEDRSGLAAGTYTVTVTDNHGCADVKAYTITEPPAVTFSTSQINVSCNAGSNGSITVTASGGTGTLEYSKDNGSTYQASNVFSGLPQGTYQIVVRDANLCTAPAQPVTISEPTTISISELHTDVSCHGGTNGSITLTVSGGTEPYTFSWSDGPTTEDRSGLPAGDFTVTVTDNNGCTAVKSVTIAQPAAALSASETHVDVSCFGGSNGSIDISVSGGTSPYTTSWNDGPTTEDRSGLAAGTYTVTVTDNKGCTTTKSVTVSEPAAPLTCSVSPSVAVVCSPATQVLTANPTGGTGPYSYLWSNAETTQAISASLPATYTVTITDARGCTTSCSAVLTVDTAPVVSLDPSAQTVVFGQELSFSSTASGSPTPALQWQVSTDGGAHFTNLNGLTESPLTFPVTMEENGHLFRAVFSNSCGSTPSAAALLTVNKASTTTQISSGANPSAFGDSVTFTATVSVVSPGAGTPAGTVTFRDGATILGTAALDGSGNSAVKVGGLSGGSHPVTASYGGDANFDTSSSGVLDQVVNRVGSSTAVASNNNPSIFSQSVTFTATVTPGAATGSVEFFDGASSLGSVALSGGSAGLSLSTLTVGSHQITAVYGGNGDYLGSPSTALTQDVGANTDTIFASSGANGSISPSGTVVVVRGSAKSFELLPNTGYHVDSLLVDGVKTDSTSGYTFPAVNGNHTIRVVFAINHYTVTATAGTHGTIAPAGPTDVSYGDSLSFTLTPDTGYHVAGLTVDGGSVGAPATYVLHGISADHNVVASFSINVYTITPAAGQHGTISPSSPVNVDHGADTTFTMNPDAGYHVDSILVDGVLIGNGLTHTFTNVTGNHSIRAVFAINTYTLTVNASNGSVAKNPDQPLYDHGTSVQLTPTAAAGYHFVDWSGDASGNANPLTVVMDGNKTITANFAVNTYTLTITANNGSVGKNPDQPNYDHGSVVALTATPNPGYHFVDWTGDASGASDPLNLTMDGNKNVTANFAINLYAIMATAGANGSISPADTTHVPHGGGQSYLFSPAAGYHVAQVLVDGNPVDSLSGYTFSNVTGDHTISVAFALNQYTLNVNVVGAGTVDKNPNQPTYGHGSTVTLTANPSPGLHFVAWSGDALGSTNPLSLLMDGNKNVTATFATTFHTITSTSGAHGTLTPPGSVQVAEGSDQPFVVTPETGYHLADLLVDDIHVDSTTGYTFRNVQTDHTIQASFAINSYTITVTSGSHGSTNPSGAVSADYGTDKKIQIAPDPGYHVDSVIVDGSFAGTPASYTFTAVSGPHTLRAVFAVNLYSITASAGSHGTISPSGVLTLPYGSSQSYVFTPDPGYHVDSVAVDGFRTDSTVSYTFNGLSANHAISAAFAINTYKITATATGGGSINPSGSVLVPYGSDKQFTFQATSGHYLSDLLVDNVHQDSTTSYTFVNVTSGHLITAQFTGCPAITVQPASLSAAPAGDPYSNTITAGGGSGPYTFAVTSGSLPTGLTLASSGLLSGTPSTPGSYTFVVTATDTRGCTGNLSYTLSLVQLALSIDDVAVTEGNSGTTDATFNVTLSMASSRTVTVQYQTLDGTAHAGSDYQTRSGLLTFNPGDVVKTFAVPVNGDTVVELNERFAVDLSNPVNAVFTDSEAVCTILNDDIDSSMYRSFDADSLILSKNLRGRQGARISRTRVREQFAFFVICGANQTGGLSVEYTHDVDPRLPLTTTPPSTVRQSGFGTRKWVHTFLSKVNAGDTVRVTGYTTVAVRQSVFKYNWISSAGVAGPSKMHPVFTMHLPRLGMPNRLTALYETFKNGGFAPTKGIVVGTIRNDSSRYYGWARIPSYLMTTWSLKDVTGMHEHSPRGFDVFDKSRTRLVHEQKLLPPRRHNNRLFADMLALKVSIAASALGLTPRGFGELVYDDGSDSPLNGKMVKDIAAYVDAKMMGCYQSGSHVFVTADEFLGCDSVVKKINLAFDGPVDTLQFAGKLVMKGTRPLSDVPYLHKPFGFVPTAIEPVEQPDNVLADEPVEYALHQNYPNPFNPVTTIAFELPAPSVVTLKVYTILGQEVTTLLDHASLDIGAQEVEFDAHALASGVYIYRIVAEPVGELDDGSSATQFTAVKKMMLLK